MRTLTEIDEQIAALERQLEKLNEERRELINYNSWNKKIIRPQDFMVNATYELRAAWGQPKADGVLIIHTPTGNTSVCKDPSPHKARIAAMSAMMRKLAELGWTEQC